jgi:alkaline phosphatase
MRRTGPARRFRQRAASLFAACLVGCAAPPISATQTRLIMLVGTGMDQRAIALARQAAAKEGRRLALDNLPAAPGIARSADRAAAMSALMTGARPQDRVLSMSADTAARAPATDNNGAPLANACGERNGEPLPTLLERLRQQGLAGGIISTGRISGIVPASAYAHLCNAALENDIAAMLAPGGAGANPALGEAGLDLVLGGGSLYFLPPRLGGKRADGRDLIAEQRESGAVVIDNIGGFRAVDAAAAPRLFGLFASDHISDEADRDAAAEPSLAEMTAKAIDLLAARSQRGYFLLVESGLIGQELESRDALRAMVEVLALDDALRAAIATAQRSDPGLAHTLLVLVGDASAAAIGQGAERIAAARDDIGLNRAIREALGV